MKNYISGVALIAVVFCSAQNLAAAEKGEGCNPLEVTAEDLVGKVYGVADPTLMKVDIIKGVAEVINIVPTEDNGIYWLDSDKGYVISYYGMTPDVSAYAEFNNDKLVDYTYFFMFPYVGNQRDAANSKQCEFCSALLTEMQDIGLVIGNNPLTSDMFEVTGSYGDKAVNLRLLDEASNPDAGQYLLILEVEPGAFTAADDIMADENILGADDIASANDMTEADDISGNISLNVASGNEEIAELTAIK